ncbi:MAG TPA: 4-(cytidine 5'-diphospho)-2-C-methyl-D-erythritol kinase [Trebonia sp.]|nr:4-(cytidine 5'-diphospho)-2-C-methyl-D-erythritol kinase [Trebonia sp.]
MNISVSVRVPAKINLQLAVGPLRPDGYHDLVTVFHAVSLYDEVTVAPAGDGNDSVTVAGEGAPDVPADAGNLALRAVRALRSAVGEQGADWGGPVRVAITKRIPVAAGMAGGSADAAAALAACDELWQTRLGPAGLGRVAAQVGSDVPFSLLGGTAIGRGRGEQLTPAAAGPGQFHWVLAYAAGSLSTPLVYKTLDQLRADGEVPVAAAGLSEELMAALAAGDAARLGAALSNDLQAPALHLFPALRQTLAAGRALGALGGLVSGSGPACFFLARDAAHGAGLADALAATGACRAVTTAAGPAAGATVLPTVA